jgi:hypothetical protein
LPIELRTIDGKTIPGIFKAPTINGQHSLPALLGLKTLMERRAIMDFTTMQISFTGPGEPKIDYSPGTDIFKMFQAPSGHLMIPCCEYQASNSRSSSSTDQLTLHASATETSDVIVTEDDVAGVQERVSEVNATEESPSANRE